MPSRFPFVERLISKHLFDEKGNEMSRPDVTDEKMRYATPKSFVFPSKRMLLMMDSNRRYRQAFNELKSTNVLEVTSPEVSINNTQVVKSVDTIGDVVTDTVLATKNVARQTYDMVTS